MSKHLFYLAKDPLPYRKLNLTLPGHAKNTLYEADDYITSQLVVGLSRRAGGRPGTGVPARHTKPKHAQYSPPQPEDPWYTAYNLYAERKGRSHPDRDHPRLLPQGLAKLDRFPGGQRQRHWHRRRPGAGPRPRPVRLCVHGPFPFLQRGAHALDQQGRRPESERAGRQPHRDL